MKPHPILSTSFLSGYRNNPPLFFTLKSNFSFKSHGILSLSPVITSCSLSLPSAIFSLKPRSVIKFAPRLTRLLCSSVLAHQATATLNPELAALPDDLIQQGPKLVFRTTRREGAKTVFRWATRAASRDRIKGEKSQEIESISASAASRGQMEPEVKFHSISIVSDDFGEINTPLPIDENQIGRVLFTLKEGSEYQLKLTFSVLHNIVSGLTYSNTVWKGGLQVDQSIGMLGTFAPNREPYEHTLEEETTPSGVLARGLYSARLKFEDDDKRCYMELKYSFEIKKRS